MLVTSQGSALRGAGATENCVFALLGFELIENIGDDDGEIGISCLSRKQAEAFQRLLETGK
jgi:hypothetical protein